MLELDYSLNQSERLEFCRTSSLPPSVLADYLLFTHDKHQTKLERSKSHPITTRNREVTISNRQTSFEAHPHIDLASTAKSPLLCSKAQIRSEDKSIQGVRECLGLVKSFQAQLATAPKPQANALKKQVIETYRTIHLLKSNQEGPQVKPAVVRSIMNMPLKDSITLNQNDMPQSSGTVSLLVPEHVSILLRNYSVLKQECCDNLHSDLYHLLLDLEALATKALKDEPELYQLLIYKIDGLSNIEIASLLGVHSEQYYSTLWCKRIPKLLAQQAAKDWLVWHYTNNEKGAWKTCGKCGEIKLAHAMFFPRNGAKFHTNCKDCRQKGK